MSETPEYTNPMLGIGDVMREVVEKEELIDADELRRRLWLLSEQYRTRQSADGSVGAHARGMVDALWLATSIVDELCFSTREQENTR